MARRVFRTVDELLSQVDVLSVAVPTSGHYTVAQACLNAGKHVLVEKPLAVTLGEAQELVQLAKQRGCCLQVGHSERFNPVMALMRPFIGRPVFIECHRLSSFSERGTDVDVVLDLMIHDLDLVLSLNPGSVRGGASCGGGGVVSLDRYCQRPHSVSERLRGQPDLQPRVDE